MKSLTRAGAWWRRLFDRERRSPDAPETKRPVPGPSTPPPNGPGPIRDPRLRHLAPPFSDRDLDVLARTLWGEARSESRDGIEAVAQVILNRVAARTWYGERLADACLKPRQFSAWNAGDPNRSKMQAVTDADDAFRLCLAIARESALGELVDRTKGATHYHTPAVHPNWSRHLTPSAVIGGHRFYNNVE